MILKPSTTRWLSLYKCVERILEQFNALTLYFTTLVAEEPNSKNNRILFLLKDPFTLPYLGFLKHFLDILNRFNGTFQSETPLLHEMKGYVTRLLLDFSRAYLKPEYLMALDSVFSIQPKEKRNFLPADEYYVGTVDVDLK